MDGASSIDHTSAHHPALDIDIARTAIFLRIKSDNGIGILLIGRSKGQHGTRYGGPFHLPLLEGHHKIGTLPILTYYIDIPVDTQRGIF